MKDLRTLADVIPNSAKKYGERDYIGTKVAGKYRWITYGEFDIRMRKLRSAIHKMGIGRGDSVAIIANNSVQFALAAYATYGLAAVFVPMYEVQKIDDWNFILRESNAKMLFVSNASIKKQIEDLKLPNLKHILVIEPTAGEKSVDDIIDAEEDLLEAQDVQPEDIADILYTSGTTGMPKGVILTHNNLIVDGRNTLSRFRIDKTDRTLALLPWAHAFGKTVELIIFPSIGVAIGLAESNRTIAQNILEVNPTIILAVPKIFNRIYDVVHAKLEDKALAKALFMRTEQLADKGRNTELSALDKIQFAILNRVVGNKIRAVFGTSIRFIVSGGVSLSNEVAFFFKTFGIEIFEGYGMTETSPIIAVNYHDNTRIGSVGKLVPDVNVRIATDPENPNSKQGEIIVSGPTVTKGYHNAPQANAEAFTEDGELRTGDMGYLDDDGYLWITGRVKEQYKLENGKYIVPSALELKITSSAKIETAVIFGASKPYNIALIIPSPELLENFKAEYKLANASHDEIANHPKLREIIASELQIASRDFRGYERPQKFAIILDEFSIENGLLTPALKIKRRQVEELYADTIAELYKKDN